MRVNFMAAPIAEQRVSDFEKLGFGMFVHFGLYSVLGQGEWAECIQKIPAEKYNKLINEFKVEKFDAKKLVQLAKNAGMKYITLTTRHHEGFSLYDTCGLNEFDAPHSLAKRDLIREFVDACNEAGIIPFFYHTTLDWQEKSFETDFKKYQEYLRASIEILCTRYGKIGGFWFDGNWSKPNEDWEEDALYSLIRKHQPDAIIVNNSGLSAQGKTGHKELDSVTFEQGRPTPMNREGMEKYIAAEMCQPINNHWGVSNYDYNYKALPEIIENLCACRKVGANYLLNISPKGDGSIPKMQEAMLELLGDWLSLFGKPLMEGKPYTIYGQGKNFSMKTEDGRIYLFVHNLSIRGHQDVTLNSENGAGPREFSNSFEEIKSIKWLDNNEEINFSQDIKSGILSMNCGGFPYGFDYVVRIAEVEI
jgi:alpha-L-fucosidase